MLAKVNHDSEAREIRELRFSPHLTRRPDARARVSWFNWIR